MRILRVVFVCALVFAYIFFFKRETLSSPRIYDCFLFYNEYDLLEMRLEEMWGVVDKFVIVEAAETFRGHQKTLNFASHRERFSKFADKIIYIPIEEHFETENPWLRERYQRDQILRGLQSCKQRDIVLISDVDEIVRQEKMSEIVSLLVSKKAHAVVLEQKMYFGHLNRFQGLWKGTIATTYKDVQRLSPKIVRKMRHMKPKRLRRSRMKRVHLLEDGGWHFSSIGGVSEYLDKIRAFSHAELDTEEFTREEHLTSLLQSCPLVPVDASFPAFLQKHQEHFWQIGFIYEDRE
jgi:beta-1,4-mannosyl-glycoprotein beta-1,4-N-acetylglucosaminyltransferase